MAFKKVYAAFPAYRDNIGNGIHVITEANDFWIEQSFATFKKHWAQAHGREWSAMLHESERILEQNRNHVVLLLEESCLIPVKTRKPRVKDDGAYGYIREDKIASIEKLKKGVRIIFTNGFEVFATTSLDTVKKYRRQAKLLRDEFKLNKGKIKKIVYYE